MTYSRVGVIVGSTSITRVLVNASILTVYLIYRKWSIITWTVNNNMKLNISKCKELIIDFSKDKRFFPPLKVADKTIDRVDSARILGTTLQSDMKWNIHALGELV